MYQDKNIRQEYAKKNISISENIKKRMVNIDKVMESYASGTSKDNIEIQYRLSEEELNYILRTYMTSEIRNRREQNYRIFDFSEYNLIIKDKSRTEKPGKKLTIQEAIDLVEGKGKGKGERED